MKRQPIVVTLLSRLKIVEGVAKGLLAIFLAVGVLCATAACEDGSTFDRTPESAETPSQDQSVSRCSTDRATMEGRIEALTKEAIRFLEDGNLKEALTTRRQTVFMLEGLVGKADWRTRTEQAYLMELVRLSECTEDQQNRYFVAYRRLNEGYQRMAIEDYGTAQELLDKAFDGFVEVLGENSIYVVAASEKLGLLSLKRESPAKAQEHFSRSAVLWKTVFGENHPAYACELRWVAYAHLEAKEFDEAEPILRNCLNRFRRLFGAKYCDYLDCLEKLSLVMIAKKRFPEAEALCLQAISVAEATQKQQSPLMAACLANLAEVNIAYDEYAMAEANLRYSLTIYEGGLRPWDPTIAKILDRYASVLRKLERSEEADAAEARATSIRNQLR